MSRGGAALCVLLLLGAGCASSGSIASTDVVAPPPVGEKVSARFRPALARIGSVRTALAGGDAARTRFEANALVDLGVTLIQARMPHDVARPDVPRYLGARRAFGDALKEVTYARDAGDDAALASALTRLEGATRRWSDAHLGLAPETSL